MAHLLNLSRAAQLLGIPRSTLQRMIRDGDLASFDGTLSTDELLRAFPDTCIDDAGLADKVSRIREESFGRRIRERILPPQEILAQRIFRQSEELTELRQHIQQYHTLVETALARLDEMPSEAGGETLRSILGEGLKQILASENNDTLEVMHDMLKFVSAHVKVRPSGREFVVEGHDTLLQAGLKAGLHLNYGCGGGGNCGLCKARIVSGEVRQTAHADYALSEAERQAGFVLTCICSPVTDVIIEALEATGPADIPPQEIVASVRAVTPLSANTLLLHLQTPRSNRLRFLAGQSITLGLSTPAGDIATTWPIASCPCDDRNIHFHIARDNANPLARHLFTGRLKPGDSVNLRGPLGDFVLASEEGRPLIFIAADTGFAPIKSLIEHAIAMDNTDTFGLVWAVSRVDGHYLDNQCRMWASAFDRFLYLPLTAEGDDDPLAVEKLGIAAARTVIENFLFASDAEIYIAGPAPFAAAAAALLEASEVPAIRRHEMIT
jgi:CDP-4-dehydro-6-deoxyglucose reductase, E3